MEGPLHGLVNNAAGNFISPTKDLSARGFDAIANIVFHGTFYVTQSVGKKWLELKMKGSIISILATWVWTGSPFVVPSASTIPMGRVGEMSELQNLATFLMADGCEYLTGQTIALDGAQYLSGGGTFSQLAKMSEDDWSEIRNMIKKTNDSDKQKRST